MVTEAVSPLLQYYRALESRAQVMLDNARESRWDEVQRVRDDCARLIADLEHAKQTLSLTPAEDRERLKILKSIVICDGQTRRLSSSRVRLFDEVLSARRDAA